MDALLAMFQNRPAVVANVVAFAVIAAAERGWLRTACWFAGGTFIGWLMEFSSTRNGFPFGMYVYHQANFAGELQLGGIPLFASFSFAALSYFGYSAACTMLSPLRKQGRDVQRVDSPAVAGSVATLVLAAVSITWMDMAMDPVTHLGRYWFLGDLYHYDPPGIHFGVPLSNYFGWLVTIFCIVLANQTIDRALARFGAAPAGGFFLPWKPFWSIAAQVGTYLMMLGVTVFLMLGDRVPQGTPLGGILASGLVLTAAYIALVAGMVRRGFARPAPRSVSEKDSG